MRFTIEDQYRLEGQITHQLIGQFDDDAWNSLWSDLGVNNRSMPGIAQCNLPMKIFH